jgi:hypothetical protein
MLHDGLDVHIGMALLARILDIGYQGGQWNRSLAVLLKPIQRKTALQRRLRAVNTYGEACSRQGT